MCTEFMKLISRSKVIHRERCENINRLQWYERNLDKCIYQNTSTKCDTDRLRLLFYVWQPYGKHLFNQKQPIYHFRSPPYSIHHRLFCWKATMLTTCTHGHPGHRHEDQARRGKVNGPLAPPIYGPVPHSFYKANHCTSSTTITQHDKKDLLVIPIHPVGVCRLEGVQSVTTT